MVKLAIQLFILSLVSELAVAHISPPSQSIQAYAPLQALRTLGIPVLAKSESAEVGFAYLTPEMQMKLSNYNHSMGKCGGFEAVALKDTTGVSIQSEIQGLKAIEALVQKDQNYSALSMRSFSFEAQPEISQALNELSEENIRQTIMWLSSFPNRDNREANPNVHVEQVHDRLKAMMSSYSLPWTIEKIAHSSTRQQSIRVTLVGKSRPDEIVVVGGHLDSINQSWMGSKAAPGADDNASGSANVIETLRVLASKGQPERTVEFYWYAGEESGLLGSAEIAKDYKGKAKKVVAVLQLDMTLFAGEGEFVIGNITDFTSAWLRDWMLAANQAYFNVKFVDDQCGYGCSDHASWYRQGYPTLLPFEAVTKSMNRNIHTVKDTFGPTSNTKHALVFSRIALAFAMDFGNSTAVQPY